VVPVFEVAADGVLTPRNRTLGSLQHDSRVSFRDLLEIEQPPSSSSSSRIFPRAHSILFHLGPARGVILRDRVVLFASNAKSSISPLAAAEELCAHIASVGREPAFFSPPLEIIAVDHFLQRMVQRQEKRVAYTRHLFLAVMADERSLGATMLPLVTSCDHYETVSRGIMQCTRALLDDPAGAGLRLLCLSERAEAEAAAAGGGAAAPVSDSTLRAVELLLEAAHHRAAGTALKANEMSRQLALKRDLLQIRQRADQNALLQRTLHISEATLRTSVASVMLSTAMCVTGLFGQNVPPGVDYAGFLAATAGASTLLALAVRAAFARGGALADPAAGAAPAQSVRAESLQTLLLNLDTRVDSTSELMRACVAELEARRGAGDAEPGLSKPEFAALHRGLVKGADSAEAELLFGLVTQTPVSGGRHDIVIRLPAAAQMLREMKALQGARVGGAP